MATLVRCDECRKLNDEMGVGYIGRKHKIIKYREDIINILIVGRDLCSSCIKKIIAEGTMTSADNDY